jgi:hypothetical protein
MLMGVDLQRVLPSQRETQGSASQTASCRSSPHYCRPASPAIRFGLGVSYRARALRQEPFRATSLAFLRPTYPPMWDCDLERRRKYALYARRSKNGWTQSDFHSSLPITAWITEEIVLPGAATVKLMMPPARILGQDQRGCRGFDKSWWKERTSQGDAATFTVAQGSETAAKSPLRTLR